MTLKEMENIIKATKWENQTIRRRNWSNTTYHINNEQFIIKNFIISIKPLSAYK